MWPTAGVGERRVQSSSALNAGAVSKGSAAANGNGDSTVSAPSKEHREAPPCRRWGLPRKSGGFDVKLSAGQRFKRQFFALNHRGRSNPRDVSSCRTFPVCRSSRGETDVALRYDAFMGTESIDAHVSGPTGTRVIANLRGQPGSGARASPRRIGTRLLDAGIGSAVHSGSRVGYVTITVAAGMTGYSIKAIRRKIESGVWVEGREFRRAPDGHVLISLRGYEQWVERGRV